MASITGIKKVTDLPLLSHVINAAQVILAYKKSNYSAYLEDIAGTKIVDITESENLNGTLHNAIIIEYADGSRKTIIVSNGNQGDQGERGEKGERGDKGDAANVSGHGAIGMIPIVNDVTTKNALAALSALQGKLIYDSVYELTETFMEDDNYQLLFNPDNMIYIDAEYTSLSDDEDVHIFNTDTSDHMQYVKYWTYEDTGSEVYYIYNDVTKEYDSTQAELWADIYLGKTSGYFEATTSQLTDGTQLYIFDQKTDDYIAISQVKDTVNVVNTDELGNKTTTKVTKYFGSKDFNYYDENLQATIRVTYDYSTGIYVYNLVATELEKVVYKQTGVNEDGTPIYSVVDNDSVDSITSYYYKDGSTYIKISKISEYLATNAIRYYKRKTDGTLEEIESLDSINGDKFEEYIICEYSNVNKTYKYTRYYADIHPLYTVYANVSSTYKQGSITFYVKTDARKYYKRISTYDNKGQLVYTYKEISIPCWLSCEYTTYDEDEITKIMNSAEFAEKQDYDKEQTVTDDYEETPEIYVTDIKITTESTNDEGVVYDKEISDLEIALNKVSDFDVKILPLDANVINLIIDYDESVIKLYEDGRIAAVSTSDITTYTTIKISSADDPTISASVRLKIVTPVSQITLNTTSTAMYIGQDVQLQATVYPQTTTYHLAKYNNGGDVAYADTLSDVQAIQLSEYSYIAYLVSDSVTGERINKIYTKYSDAEKELPQYNVYTYEVYWDQAPAGYAYDKIDEFLYEDMTTYNDAYMQYVSETATYTYWKSYYATYNIPESIWKRGFTYGTYTFKQRVDNTGEITYQESNSTYIYTTSNPSVTNEEVIWSSSNTDVITVDQYGKLTAKVTGETATITARAKDGYGAYANCKVTVAIPITSFAFTNDSIGFVGVEKKLAFTFTPDNATIKALTYTVSDKRMATVSDMGIVKPIKSGTFTVYATTTDGTNITMQQNISVTNGVASVKINETNVTMDKRTTYQFTASVLPATADNTNIVWSTDAEEVWDEITQTYIQTATIDKNGLFTTDYAGVVNVTATAEDGTGHSDKTKVTIVTPIESITLSDTLLNIYEGDNQRIDTTILPIDATSTKVTWSSLDDTIARVNNGVINGVSVGRTTIICAATDNSGIFVTCVVNVLRAVTAITLDQPAIRLRLGMSTTLTATVTPDDATNQIVTWSSSNNNVAVVNSNGVVRSVGIGSATITATANGGKDIKIDIPVAIVDKNASIQTIASITNNLSYMENTNTYTTALIDSEYKAKLTYDTTLYNTVDVSIYVGETDVTSTSLTKSTLDINIAKVTDDITIIGSATYIAPIVPVTPEDDSYSYNDSYSYYDAYSYNDSYSYNDAYSYTD